MRRKYLMRGGEADDTPLTRHTTPRRRIRWREIARHRNRLFRKCGDARLLVESGGAHAAIFRRGRRHAITIGDPNTGHDDGLDLQAEQVRLALETRGKAAVGQRSFQRGLDTVDRDRDWRRNDGLPISARITTGSDAEGEHEHHGDRMPIRTALVFGQQRQQQARQQQLACEKFTTWVPCRSADDSATRISVRTRVDDDWIRNGGSCYLTTCGASFPSCGRGWLGSEDG